MVVFWHSTSNQQRHELWFGIRVLNFDQGHNILHVMLCHQILGGTTRCEGSNIIYYNEGNVRPQAPWSPGSVMSYASSSLPLFPPLSVALCLLSIIGKPASRGWDELVLYRTLG